MPFTVTVTGSGRLFEARAEESLLDAAARASMSLPWRCSDGSCGSCRAYLLQGTCSLPDGTLVKAAAGDADPQPVLLCQASPRSPVSVHADGIKSVDDIACRLLQLELHEKTLLTPQALSLKLRVLGNAPVRWLPGQYLEMLLPAGGRRAFSIANACDGTNIIELHVRHIDGGSFSQWAFNELEVGMRLRAEAPLGTFVPRENSQRPILFVAGGTGFAPIKAMIEHFVQIGSSRHMHLYWGARQLQDLYLREHVEQWVFNIPNLAFQAVISDPHAHISDGMRRGMVVDAVLADHPQLEAHDVYVCGPPAMIDAAGHAFRAARLPAAQLFVDSYEYAPDVLASILQQRAGIDGD